MSLPAHRMLDVWEQAHSSNAAARTRWLLSLSEPQLSDDELDNLTLGESNSRLVNLRRSLFGAVLQAYVECPHCGEALDLEFPIEQLGFDAVPEQPAELFIRNETLSASARLPNGHDLAALSLVNSVDEGRALLFSRCLWDLRRNGKAVELGDLNESELTALENLVAELDPRTELLFDLSCPACANQWQSSLDAGAFLWREFDTHIRELLENIHLLARAYGWSEADILAMSDARRAYYVQRLLQ